MLNKLLDKIKKNKTELVIVAVLLLISGIAHGYNMFHFPYYTGDEGVYMSYAWSLLTQGKLSPYTYWYDHAPAGWMLIAIWTKLTGGFFTFGTSVNSGRVLMLLLHLGTVSLLFYIAKKLSKGNLAGVIATLIFSLSPLGIYFQRRVQLDNIMVFWVFLSLALLLKEKVKLRHIIASAIAFGVAVLTKENAIFFIPLFFYLVYSRSHEYHREFALVNWLAIAGSVISVYFLYALLKGEFFPVGFLGNNASHVSLLSTLQEQLNRGGVYPFWDKRSDFYINLIEWVSRDFLTITLGVVATVLGIVISSKERALRIPAFLATLFWIFLMRGKLVIDFYIIPLIPLLALNIGMLINFITKKLSFRRQVPYYLLAFGAVFLISAYLLTHPIGQYTKDETAPQIKAIGWVKENMPEGSIIIIDNSIYVDLHEKRFLSDKIFPKAEWAFKIELDEDVRSKSIDGDWRKIQYLAIGHEILEQISADKFHLLKRAINNAYLIADWKEGSTSYFDLKNYISTNGDWMSIYKVKDKHHIALDNSWEFYKENFIKSYGQVLDPHNDLTTSEGQSYAMLRAVWQDDKDTFNGVWAWAKNHLQYRTQDKLFSWLWIKDGNEYKIGDSASASDADEDIALALLFAYKRWGDETYLEEAKEVIKDIWKQEVVELDGRYYLTSGTGAGREAGYLINPSYLSPATYRIFAEVDTVNPWNRLANDSYYLLNQVGNKNETHLPPNWVLVDTNTGEIMSASQHISDEDAGNYGFDAFRVMWRVALDARWFDAPEAKAYLQKVSPFFKDEWLENKEFAAAYNLSGEAKSNFSSLSTSTGALSVLTLSDKGAADEVYNELFDKEFNYEEGFWGDRNNYYAQNWAWFGTALYTDNLPNLWSYNTN